MKIRAIQDTFIKASPVQAVSLPHSEVILLPKDKEIEVKWSKFFSKPKHYQFELSSPLNGRFNWWAFSEHVRLLNEFPTLSTLGQTCCNLMLQECDRLGITSEDQRAYIFGTVN